jgi:acyl-CoA reductase-like NAD-dependent aldehyde dehydrogenase
MPQTSTASRAEQASPRAMMLIDGSWSDSESGKRDEIRNPATGKLLATVPAGTAADAKRAIAAAAHGSRRIAATPAHERCAILMRLAQAIEDRQQELGDLLTAENGKTRREIGGEIKAAIRIVRGYAEEAKRVFGKLTPLDSIPGLERSVAVTARQPRGVIAAIVPFNYPVELWTHKLAGALASGNAVITKPPEQCPLTVIRVSELLEQTGLPRGAHQLLTGDGDVVGAALVQSSGVHMICMTGSTAAGRAILRDAAPTLKKVHLELGGNDATIVCADADPARVAESLVAGRFTSGNGQICCAVKRVLVDESLYPALVDAVISRARGLKIGDPADAATDVGPLVTEQAATVVEEQIAAAVREGATIALGGRRNGSFIEPTVLTGVKPDHRAFNEEIFGPVLPIVPFADFEEALALANQSVYGLQAAVFTHDLGRIMRAFQALDVGTLVVNRSTAIRVENLPFGGMRASGNGREGIHETLLEMTEEKTMILADVFAAPRLPG